jgi:hypothetical protein
MRSEDQLLANNNWPSDRIIYGCLSNRELIKQRSEKRDFHNMLYTLFIYRCKLKNLVENLFMKNYNKKIGML